MKKLTTILLCMALAGCGAGTDREIGSVKTNDQGQPKSFDLKGLKVGLTLSEVSKLLGGIDCMPAKDQMAAKFGPDWVNNKALNERSDFAVQKVLLTEESDAVCIAKANHKLANVDARAVLFVKDNRTRIVSFVFVGSETSVLDSLGYKCGWVNMDQVGQVDELERIKIKIMLSNGYRDQRGDVLVLSHNQGQHEIAIYSSQSFDKVIKASQFAVEQQSGVNNL